MEIDLKKYPFLKKKYYKNIPHKNALLELSVVSKQTFKKIQYFKTETSVLLQHYILIITLKTACMQVTKIAILKIKHKFKKFRLP